MKTRSQFLNWTAPFALATIALSSGCSSDASSDAGTAGAGNLAGAGNGVGGASMAGNAGTPAAGSSSGGTSAAGSRAVGADGGAAVGGSAGSAGVGGGGAAGSGGNGGRDGAGGSGGSAGSGGTSGGAAGSGGAGGGAAFVLTSPAWTSESTCSAAQTAGCGVFPKANINTGIGGENKSPQLDWTAGPSGTKSYAIVLHDLTNLMAGKPFVHWVMWNIPATTLSLPAGLETTAMPTVPAGSSQRSYGGSGYQGSGKCGNVYEFVLYALTTPSFTPSGTNQTAAADGLEALGAPTASLRARSGAPGCTP